MAFINIYSESGGSLPFSSTLDAINAVSSAVDVLASIQSRCESAERIGSRSVSLREMMRRASSVARAVSGLEMRDSDREDSSSLTIPTLTWPPDPLDATRAASG